MNLFYSNPHLKTKFSQFIDRLFNTRGSFENFRFEHDNIAYLRDIKQLEKIMNKLIEVCFEFN